MWIRTSDWGTLILDLHGGIGFLGSQMDVLPLGINPDGYSMTDFLKSLFRLKCGSSI